MTFTLSTLVPTFKKRLFILTIDGTFFGPIAQAVALKFNYFRNSYSQYASDLLIQLKVLVYCHLSNNQYSSYVSKVNVDLETIGVSKHILSLVRLLPYTGYLVQGNLRFEFVLLPDLVNEAELLISNGSFTQSCLRMSSSSELSQLKVSEKYTSTKGAKVIQLSSLITEELIPDQNPYGTSSVDTASSTATFTTIFKLESPRPTLSFNLCWCMLLLFRPRPDQNDLKDLGLVLNLIYSTNLTMQQYIPSITEALNWYFDGNVVGSSQTNPQVSSPQRRSQTSSQIRRSNSRSSSSGENNQSESAGQSSGSSNTSSSIIRAISSLGNGDVNTILNYLTQLVLSLNNETAELKSSIRYLLDQQNSNSLNMTIGHSQ